MTYITEKAIEVVNFIKNKGLEVRFSSEDSFRSDLVDLLSIYRTMDRVSTPPVRPRKISLMDPTIARCEPCGYR